MTANIDIPDDNAETTLTGQTGTGPFAFSFAYFADTDIEVFVDDALLSSDDYTISPTGSYAGVFGGYSGGTVTLDNAVTSAKIVIRRQKTISRTDDFSINGIEPDGLNAEFDVLTAGLQDLSREVKRAVRLGPVHDQDMRLFGGQTAITGKVIGFQRSDETTPGALKLIDQAQYESVANSLANVNAVADDIVNVNAVAADLSGDNDIGTVASFLDAGTPTSNSFIQRATGGAYSYVAVSDYIKTLLNSASLSVLRTSLGLGQSSSPTFANLTITGDISSVGDDVTINDALTVIGALTNQGVTFAPTGAVVGQSLGFPNSTSILEPFTALGDGDVLAAANGSDFTDPNAFKKNLHITLDTIAELTALLKADLADGEEVNVKGYEFPFKWEASATDTAISNIILASDEGGSGRWKLQYTDYFRPHWFGAATNGTTDASAAFNAMEDARSTLGVYEVRGRRGDLHLVNNWRIKEKGTYYWEGVGIRGDFNNTTPGATERICYAQASDNIDYIYMYDLVDIDGNYDALVTLSDTGGHLFEFKGVKHLRLERFKPDNAGSLSQTSSTLIFDYDNYIVLSEDCGLTEFIDCTFGNCPKYEGFAAISTDGTHKARFIRTVCEGNANGFTTIHAFNLADYYSEDSDIDQNNGVSAANVLSRRIESNRDRMRNTRTETPVNGTDGAITSGSSTFTSAGAAFTDTKNGGAPITITGAGAGGADLVTTILDVVDANTLTLADTAGTTVSGANYSTTEYGGSYVLDTAEGDIWMAEKIVIRDFKGDEAHRSLMHLQAKDILIEQGDGSAGLRGIDIQSRIDTAGTNKATYGSWVKDSTDRSACQVTIIGGTQSGHTAQGASGNTGIYVEAHHSLPIDVTVHNKATTKSSDANLRSDHSINIAELNGGNLVLNGGRYEDGNLSAVLLAGTIGTFKQEGVTYTYSGSDGIQRAIRSTATIAAWLETAVVYDGDPPSNDRNIAGGSVGYVALMGNRYLTDAGAARVQSNSGTFDIDYESDIGGQTLIGAGTASAPGIARVGDTNSGVYWSGDDEIALVTGGSVRQFVKSGRIGLGNAWTEPLAVPDSAFHIWDSAPFIIMQDTGDTTTSVALLSLRANDETEIAWMGLGSSGNSIFTIRNNYGDVSVYASSGTFSFDSGGLDIPSSRAFSIGGTDVITSSRHPSLRSYTVGTVPTATTGELIYVSDDVGGATVAFADGTDWRRMSDRAVVSTT